jgi:hypothetical protein
MLQTTPLRSNSMQKQGVHLLRFYREDGRHYSLLNQRGARLAGCQNKHEKILWMAWSSVTKGDRGFSFLQKLLVRTHQPSCPLSRPGLACVHPTGLLVFSAHSCRLHRPRNSYQADRTRHIQCNDVSTSLHLRHHEYFKMMRSFTPEELVPRGASPLASRDGTRPIPGAFLVHTAAWGPVVLPSNL